MKSEAMFNFKRVDEVPLPIWLSQQAVAAAPVNSERERLLREDDKEKDKKCNRRVRTLALIITLVFTIALLVALITLVVQAITTVSSAKASVGTRMANLLNLTESIGLETRASVNSIRGASRNAELFTAVSFENVQNATAHLNTLSEHLERSLYRPITLSMTG